MDTQEHQDLLKEIHPPPTRRRVIVFDIDDTLCNQAWFEEEEFIRNNHPDCPLIVWKKQYDRWIDSIKHVFLPHLQILFDYLLKHGARVAFFSSGPKERNEFVIRELLTSFYESEKYEALRAKGQFNIHSEDDLREGEHRGEGNYVKDLKAVIRDGESLSEMILVDDQQSFAAHDQHPVLLPVDLMCWDFSCQKYFYKDCKNGVYYMLGLFKTLFEDEKYRELALKDAFVQILPENEYYPTRNTDSFKRNMVDVGLSEVQKRLPDATLFGSSSSSDYEI